MTDRPAVLAIDVGNSKTDAALVAADGRLLAAARGPSASHQAAGLEAAMRALGALADRLASEAGLVARPKARVAACCMAGVDLPGDRRLLTRELRRLGIGEDVLLVNDTYAPLRAGTDRGWGVAVVCGSGINALGIGPTGRVARFAALGSISGDWGGGESLGAEALGAAVRAQEGRGPRTSLERDVPRHFGLRRSLDVTIALYYGRLHEDRLAELAPVVMAAASSGDAVAGSILDRLATEVASFAVAAIRRAGLIRAGPDVVLSGGLMRPRHPRVLGGIRAAVSAVAPSARLVVLDAPPVVGAALLGLDRLSATGRAKPAAAARIRHALTEARLAPC